MQVYKIYNIKNKLFKEKKSFLCLTFVSHVR